jgi:hypothetical protein
MKRFFFLILLALFLVSCGGGGSTIPNPNHPTVAMTRFRLIVGDENGGPITSLAVKQLRQTKITLTYQGRVADNEPWRDVSGSTIITTMSVGDPPNLTCPGLALILEDGLQCSINSGTALSMTEGHLDVILLSVGDLAPEDQEGAAKVTFTAPSATAVLWVTDKPNYPPEAQLTADKVSGPAPFTVTFNASGSEGLEDAGSIYGYAWFSDSPDPSSWQSLWEDTGTVGFPGDAITLPEEPSFTHTYSESGQYRAMVIVVNLWGLKDYAILNITVT